MLEFVRPIRLQVERTDIADVLHQAVTLAESKVAARRDFASVSTSTPELPLIDGDQHQLCQVFTNLLTNAFEALEGRGHVDIRASVEAARAGSGASPSDRSRRSPMLVVDVTDNGPGVPADLSDRIFDPFFTTKPQGSGLGLPIVRKIVDAHDGRIDLNSTPGPGTRFRVTLPVSSASSWFNRVDERRRKATRLMGRILIADDHDALRRGLVRGLTEAGHEVEEASNGNAAIERLHDSYFDVVLSDLKMGGSDGLDVLRTTRAHASDDRGHSDDGVRIGEHRGRGDEDRRLRLRAEAVRNRGDGGQDREGARNAAPEARARVPPRHAAGHLRLRPHRRLEHRAAEGARHRAEGGEEQHDRAHSRRNRHRQGADRRRDAPQLAARRRATSSR